MAHDSRTLKPLLASAPLGLWDDIASPPVESQAARPIPSPSGICYLGKQVIASSPFIASDILAISGASGIALVVSGQPWDVIARTAAAFTAVYVGGAAILGVYPGVGLHPVHEIRQCARVVALAFFAMVVAEAADGRRDFATNVALAIIAAVALPGIPIFRMAARRLASRSAVFTQPVLVFGGGQSGAAAFAALRDQPASLLRPLGIIAESAEQWADETTDPHWYIGVPEEAAAIAARHGVYWAMVADSAGPQPAARIDPREFVPIPHQLCAAIGPASITLEADTLHLGSTTVVHQVDRLLLPWSQHLKRTIDLTLSLALLIPCVPLMLAISLLVKLTSRGPIFFTERRIGRGGREFIAWKFRTMHVNAKEMLDCYLEEHPSLSREWKTTHKLKNDPRVTRIGRFLRKSSLDELPQLFNVIIGDMSLIGPRPIVSDEIPRYGKDFWRYCRVRPGVTGLWQVSGRNDTTYEARVAYDAYYANNWSVWFDAWILARTVNVVLFCKGAY